MGDRLQPSRYVASHSGQLGLAIPPWVGTVSTGESWDVNRYTARCTSPVSVVWQCKLVSGWGLMKRRSASPYGSYGSGRTLRFTQFAAYLSERISVKFRRVTESVPRTNQSDFDGDQVRDSVAGFLNTDPGRMQQLYWVCCVRQVAGQEEVCAVSSLFSTSFSFSVLLVKRLQEKLIVLLLFFSSACSA